MRWYAAALLFGTTISFAGTAAAADEPVRPPVIDVHMHAYQAGRYGPSVQTICAPYDEWPSRDAAEPIERYLETYIIHPDCARPLSTAATDDELRDRSIAEMRRLNIVAVTSGDADYVERWRQEAPDRIIPALHFGLKGLPDIGELRRLHAAGRLKVLGELVAQTIGLAPNDPSLEPYYALAEELDIPLSIHIGLNSAGIAYYGAPKYRASLSDPLLLEEVLLRHPKMRIYVSHAGYPLGDQMIALMQAHPQVYVDTAAIDFVVPRAEFHRYLQRLVEAGFGKRIMFGSDQMIWPDAMAVGIDNIESADFLTSEQKRDILYNNAVRFLRLKP